MWRVVVWMGLEGIERCSWRVQTGWREIWMWVTKHVDLYGSLKQWSFIVQSPKATYMAAELLT